MSQMDAGERPPSPTREDEEEPPPLGEDPAGQEVPAAAITGREGGIHENSESIKRFEEILREEARGMLTGYLRDGTEYLSSSTVRQVVHQLLTRWTPGWIRIRIRTRMHSSRSHPVQDLFLTHSHHMVCLCDRVLLRISRRDSLHLLVESGDGYCRTHNAHAGHLDNPPHRRRR